MEGVMKSKSYRLSAAALALVICVSIAPASYAGKQTKDFEVREKVVKFLKKLQSFFGVTSLDDFPQPPKP
jgi:hypothetical protein